MRRLKYVARRLGMPYQTYTRGLILRGLRGDMDELKARDRAEVAASEQDC